MAQRFRPTRQKQTLIFLGNPRHMMPDDHDFFFVEEIVNRYDISPIFDRYRQDGQGGRAYDPQAMVLLVSYAYYRSIRSTRAIEECFDDSLGFRAIFPICPPDHATISRFRQKNGDILAGLFDHILRECETRRLVDPEVGSLDGTKMKANAALSSNATLDVIEKKEARIAEEDAAESAESVKDRKAPAGKRRGRKSRKERLERARKQLEEKKDRIQAQEARKAEERARKEAETGKKVRGRKPAKKSCEEIAKNVANTTDPDSRILKTQKGFVQGYNAQIVVTRQQIILAAHLTQEANDMHQLHPMIEETRKNLAALGYAEDALKTILADAGYCSEENLRSREGSPIDILSPPKKDRDMRKALRESPGDPSGTELPRTTREGMAAYLTTEEGRARYTVRGSTVEPTFGQIKENRHCRGFMRRGIKACRDEWDLICAMHNLHKIRSAERSQKVAA